MLCVLSHLYLVCVVLWGLDLTTFACLFPCISFIICLSPSQSYWETCFFPVYLQQLRANVREMEKLCTRVRAEDTDALEALVKPVKDRASAAARDFLLLHSNPVHQPAPPPAAQPSSCVSNSCHADDDVCEEPVSGRQIQLLLPQIPADQIAAESWDNLEEVWGPDPNIVWISILDSNSK